MSEKKFYITTSIAYTNAPPHIGFALEAVQADALSRYRRSLGENVFFLTGTDEHGQKVVKAAEEAKENPEKFTDEISGKFQELTKALNLSNNDFIRTSDRVRHWPAVQDVWVKLKKNDDIYKKQYEGLYCIGCEAFITKKDLVKNCCRVHQKEPEIIKEENYFFKLSKYSKRIEEIIKKDKVRIIPQTKKNEIMSFVEQGLEDVSFSRPRKDLQWGIPVPGDDSQTIYVWADALTNYISSLGYPDGKNFKNFWPANVHCIGKDILRFHSTIWLGMLLSLGLDLPKCIFVHGHITFSGQKMSKSLGNVVDPFALVNQYGADAVRYFLLREIPPNEDGDFTEEKFKKRYNADLAGGIGNLVARVVTLAQKFEIRTPLSQTNPKFKIKINKTAKNYKKALEKFEFNKALSSIWALISFCDRCINEEKPWSFDATRDKEKIKEVIGNLLMVLGRIAEMLKPFLPETSDKILKQLADNKSKPLFLRSK